MPMGVLGNMQMYFRAFGSSDPVGEQLTWEVILQAHTKVQAESRLKAHLKEMGQENSFYRIARIIPKTSVIYSSVEKR